MLIDLHTHSTASDGTDTPEAVIAAAVGAGLDVVGLTDHDTTAGWQAARAALPPGLTLVEGAELSCAFSRPDGGRTSIHLLAYLFDPQHEGLRAERGRLRADRFGRGKAIVDNLVADGVDITWDQVRTLAGGGPIGRPHIGRALAANGVVADVPEAFAGYLSSRSKYYVRKADSDVFDTVRLVRDAGGIPVFAHPLARRRGRVVGDEVVAAMVRAGLQGIEVDHPDHEEPDRRHLAGLAGDLGLVRTGSSDYHGTNKPTPIAMCHTDPGEFERLLALPAARAPITA